MFGIIVYFPSLAITVHLNVAVYKIRSKIELMPK